MIHCSMQNITCLCTFLKAISLTLQLYCASIIEKIEIAVPGLLGELFRIRSSADNPSEPGGQYMN